MKKKVKVIATTLDEFGNEKEKVLARFSTPEKAQEYIDRKEQDFADNSEIYAVYIEE